MSITAAIQKVCTLGSVSFSESRNISGTDGAVFDITLAAAEAGELTTRTSDTVGTLTMDDSSHGITTGVRLDIYWTGGRRYGVTVGTVSGNSVPFTGGAGDNLPIATTDITAQIPTQKEVNIDGADVVAAAAAFSALGLVTYETSGDAEIVTKDVGASASWIWNSSDGSDNPFGTSTIANIYVSQSGISSATAKVGLLV